jgi:hypothetical protein
MKRILASFFLLTSLTALGQTPTQQQLNAKVNTTTFNQAVQNLNDLVATRLTQSQASTLYKSINYVPAWGEITGKPSTFAPSAHTHAPGEINLDATHRFVTDAQINGWNSLSGAGFSGNYNDLTNRPTLSTVASTGSYTDLTGRPSLFSGSYTDLTNRPTLFSGSYADLTNKPTIPTVPSALSAFTNDVGYVTAAGAQTTFDARYRRQSVLVDYINDVTNKPTIPTNTSQLTNGAGFATTTDVTNAVAGKQNTLVSGTNLKTVNGTSLLGSGNITIAASGSATSTADIRAAIGAANGILYSTADGLISLNNATVNTLIENKLKSFDGYDASVSKVLSTTGTSFKWVVASVGSGTGVVGSGPVSPRDTVLAYADSTRSRIDVGTMTAVSITSVAQLRAFLTTTQTNKNATVTDGVYNDGQIFEQTGNWTNVWIHPQTVGGATISNNTYSTAWIYTNTHSVNRVKVSGFKFISGYTATTDAYPIYWSNELVTIDGLETTDCEITANGNGRYNGWNMAQYSANSSQGAMARNIFFHKNYVHHCGRAGSEILSQGYDYARIVGLVITNNRFENNGINDVNGFGSSLSGYIKGALSKGNIFRNNRGIHSEWVNVVYGLSISNVFSQTAGNSVTGLGISDDGVGTTRYLYFENNTMQTTGRPFYVYDSRDITFTGGTYQGNYGVDMTRSSDLLFKDMGVTVWDNVSSGGSGTSFAWQIDTPATRVTLDGVNLSSSGTMANGGLYAREVIVIKGSNNIIKNSIFTQGRQSNNSYYGFVIANSGTGNFFSNNQEIQGQ